MPREIAKNFIMSLGTVTLRFIALFLMFVVRTRFPVKHSIVNVLRKRYGKILAKNVRIVLIILLLHAMLIRSFLTFQVTL